MALLASAADAEPRTKVLDVCKGCIASMPKDSDTKSTPAPLLVTLHGDWGAMAPEVHASWERYAAPRGVVLLSLTCPPELGCKKSWWQWNGDPAWIGGQVDRLASRVAIDRDRMWLAGWSGGATYMGMHTQELERKFAAFVFQGGGVWPLRAGCTKEKIPTVFLAGDKNPLHEHILVLRKHYEECGNEVTFFLLKGADHDGEWSSLDKRGKEVMEILWAKKKPIIAEATPPSAPAPSETAAPVPSAAASQPPPVASHPPEPVHPRSGCSCDLAAASEGVFSCVATSMLALCTISRRRRRLARERAEDRCRPHRDGRSPSRRPSHPE
jgi:hypothetical protein